MLTLLHSFGSWVLILAALLYSALGAGIWLTGSAPSWSSSVAPFLLLVTLGQTGLGVLQAFSDGGPSEVVHWIYAGAVLGLLIANVSYVPELSPRFRGPAMIGSGVLWGLLAWRLAGTG